MSMEDVCDNTSLMNFQASLGLNGVDPCSTTLPFALQVLSTWNQAESYSPKSNCPAGVKDSLKNMFKMIWGINNAGQSVDVAYSTIDSAIDTRYS